MTPKGGKPCARTGGGRSVDPARLLVLGWWDFTTQDQQTTTTATTGGAA